jgi:NodT family efflux transporter outer membrane factor (OMF) lipoprotein
VPYVTNVYQAEFQASYEVDLWGRLAAQTDAAGATYQAEQANAEAAALSIAATVASGYLNLRGLDAQLELTEATLKLREQSRDLAKRQFDVGYSSRLEWLQAQAEYQTTAEQLPQLRRSIFEQENALSVLVGANPGAVARGLALEVLSPPPVPAGLPSELLRRRPDIARAEFNLVAANANLAAVRDQMLPSFKLTAVGGVQNLKLHDLINAPTALWRLTGLVVAPLYEGDRIQHQTDAAAAQRDQTVFAYENTVRGAFAETDNSLGAIFRLKQQAVENDARRATAAETLRIAHNRYRNGYASYLEELDAQRTLYNADVGRLQLKTRILLASVDLYRAMGGGWAPHQAGN